MSSLGNVVSGIVYAPYIPVTYSVPYYSTEIEPLEMMMLLDMFGYDQTETVELMYRLPDRPGVTEFTIIATKFLPMPQIEGCIEYNMDYDKTSDVIRHCFKIMDESYNKLIKEYIKENE